MGLGWYWVVDYGLIVNIFGVETFMILILVWIHFVVCVKDAVSIKNSISTLKIILVKELVKEKWKWIQMGKRACR